MLVSFLVFSVSLDEYLGLELVLGHMPDNLLI